MPPTHARSGLCVPFHPADELQWVTTPDARPHPQVMQLGSPLRYPKCDELARLGLLPSSLLRLFVQLRHITVQVCRDVLDS